MTLRTVFLALLAAGVAGCSSVSMTSHDTVKRLPTTQVEIFRPDAKPQRPYKDIAAIWDDGEIESRSAIERKLAELAREIGGNALLLEPPVRSGVDVYRFKALVVVYQ